MTIDFMLANAITRCGFDSNNELSPYMNGIRVFLRAIFSLGFCRVQSSHFLKPNSGEKGLRVPRFMHPNRVYLRSSLIKSR